MRGGFALMKAGLRGRWCRTAPKRLGGLLVRTDSRPSSKTVKNGSRAIWCLAIVLIAGARLGWSRQIALNSCRILDKPGANYVLQNDVTSDGTCFSVQADGITLDLNGHTVTY